MMESTWIKACKWIVSSYRVAW